MERARVPTPYEPDLEARDHVVVLRGISWEQYVAIDHARGEVPRPLFAYLDGELEIVVTSLRHEFVKKLAARLVEAYAEECGSSLNGFGMATQRNEAVQAAAEPDESYYVGREPSDAEPSPDLVIEVVHTSGGIDKLEVYRRLGVREVWFWINGHFYVYCLEGGAYSESSESAVLPGIDLELVARIIASTGQHEQTEAVRSYRRSLRRGQGQK